MHKFQGKMNSMFFFYLTHIKYETFPNYPGVETYYFLKKKMSEIDNTGLLGSAIGSYFQSIFCAESVEIKKYQRKWSRSMLADYVLSKMLS